MTYKTRKTASQQLSGIFFVVFIHIGVVYIIASGLGHQAVQAVMGPIETKVIEEKKPQQEELPPPPPKIETPPPYVPPPDIMLAPEPTAAPTTAIRSVTNEAKPVQVAAPPAPDVEPRFNPRGRRNAPDESDYPQLSRKFNEEGDVFISILVNADGSVGDVRVDKSSGFERLDAAAVEFYKSGKPKLLPATKGGQPIAAWKSLKVTWKLKK